ncbi:MAG: flavodoxin family protein [Anaerolineae bacterium]|nr:flavodoxin family protein [Anaerolineae bacterium]
MKLLAINASHRGEQGRTHFLINRLFLGATEAGADCEAVSLARLKINRCLACRQCQTQEHHLQCIQKDDVQQVFDKMAAADVLIYATPVYLYSMTGLLKTLLDRIFGVCDIADTQVSRSGLMHHHINEAVCRKPFVTLVVCGNIEVETTKNVLSYFRTYARFMDAPRVGTLVRNAAGYLGPEQAPDMKNPRVKAVCEAYEQAGSDLATRGRVRPATQRKANRELVPVPMFGLLRRLPFRPLKLVMAAEARKMASGSPTANGKS